MAVNLLHKIHDKLDDRLTGQMGGLLGENEERTRAGIAAAVPTLLRGIMGVATTEQGTQMVERELDALDAGIVGGFGKRLEFDKSRGLIADGSDMVQAFLGNGTIRVHSVISRESGLAATNCRSLTGMLMPLMLGVIGDHRMERNLDTTAFRRLLADQSDYVAHKVPDGVCAALNLPKLEKTQFYPPPGFRPKPDGSAAPNSTTADVAATTNLMLGTSGPATAATTRSVTLGSSRSTATADAFSEGGLAWLWGVILPFVLLVSLLGWLFLRDHGELPNDGVNQSAQADAEAKRISASLDWDDPVPPASQQIDPQSVLSEEIPTLAPSFDEEEAEEVSTNDEQSISEAAESRNVRDAEAPADNTDRTET